MIDLIQYDYGRQKKYINPPISQGLAAITLLTFSLRALGGLLDDTLVLVIMISLLLIEGLIWLFLLIKLWRFVPEAY